MDPKSVIVWAVCLGIAWLLFASLTGADEWLRRLFGTSRTSDLEARIASLESRLQALEKKTG
jgi:hypothetical protein